MVVEQMPKAENLLLFEKALSIMTIDEQEEMAKEISKETESEKEEPAKEETEESDDNGKEDDDTHSHTARLGLSFAKLLNKLSGHAELGGKYAKGKLYGIPESDSEETGLKFNPEGTPVFIDADAMLQALFTKVVLVLNGQFGIRPTFETNRVNAFTGENPDITGNPVYLSNPCVAIAGVDFSAKWQTLSRRTQILLYARTTGQDKNSGFLASGPMYRRRSDCRRNNNIPFARSGFSSRALRQGTG
jgi:hypothetical protein